MSDPLKNSPLILVIEDEVYLRTLLQQSLEMRGCRVLAAEDGEQGIQLLGSHPVELLLLDLGLPKIDGISLCADIRQWSDVPIIMLTARNSADSIAEGLFSGADDYIAKPFMFSELEARIYGLLRRVAIAQGKHEFPILIIGDIELDCESKRVTIQGKAVDLTSTECNVLYNLMQAPNHIMSHQTLIRRIWGFDPGGKPRILHTNIHRLREKIEDSPANPQYIVTVPGIGYKFCPVWTSATHAT